MRFPRGASNYAISAVITVLIQFLLDAHIDVKKRARLIAVYSMKTEWKQLVWQHFVSWSFYLKKRRKKKVKHFFY